MERKTDNGFKIKVTKKKPYLKCLMNVYRYTMFKVNTTCCFLDFRPSADRQTSLILITQGCLCNQTEMGHVKSNKHFERQII